MAASFYSKNSHPDDLHILKQLGIVERSKYSFSEDELDEMKTANGNGGYRSVSGTLEMASESEDEVLFEKDAFIKNKQRILTPDSSSLNSNDQNLWKNRKSSKVVSWHLFLQHAAFFICGLCLSIIGPTMGSLQTRGFSDWPLTVMFCVTLNAFGIILGVLLGELLYRRFNPFCVLTFASFLCALTTLSISWCRVPATLLLIFCFQGLTIGLIEKGVFHIYFLCWRQKYQVYMLLYFSMALGCSVSPIFVSSLLVDSEPKLSVIGTNFSSFSVTGQTAPHLMDKRAAGFPHDFLAFNDTGTVNLTDFSSNVNFTIFDAAEVTFLNSNVTTLIPTVKVKKPDVADGTNIEPPILLADSNKLVPVEKEKPTVLRAPSTTISTPSNSNILATKHLNISKKALQIENGTTQATLSFPSVKPTTVLLNGSLTKLYSHTTSQPQAVSPSVAIVPVSVRVQMTTTSAYRSLLTSAMTISGNATVESNGTTPTSLLGNLWSKVLVGRTMVEQSISSNVDYAYVMVSVCVVVLFMLYAVTCCFSSSYGILRRNVVVDTSKIGLDATSTLTELTFARLRANFPTNCSLLIVAGTFNFLAGGFESIMANTVVLYCGGWNAASRSVGVLATFTFWCGVAASRLAAALCYKRAWRSNVVLAGFVLALAFLSLALLFASPDWPRFTIICTLAVGASCGFVTPTLACWFDERTTPGAWLMSFGALCEHMGRAIAPLVVAYFVRPVSLRITASSLQQAVPMTAIVWLTIFCLVTVFGRRIVDRRYSVFTSSVYHNSALIRRVKNSNGQMLEYQKHVNELDDLETETD